jgi:hypothetical protein
VECKNTYHQMIKETYRRRDENYRKKEIKGIEK